MDRRDAQVDLVTLETVARLLRSTDLGSIDDRAASGAAITAGRLDDGSAPLPRRR